MNIQIGIHFYEHDRSGDGFLKERASAPGA
jgi:hypothetical protein